MPVAVVIGNDPGARPQAGLSRARIVWEILAEGFITRYLAIFSGRGAVKIGPVRSARIYFDQLDRAYGIPFAHAGGNVDALNWIGTWRLENLDQIYGSGAYFWRGTHRVPPDNLYTSTALLNAAVRHDGFPARSLAFPPTAAAPAGGRATGAVGLTYLRDPGVYTYIAGWRWRQGWWYRSINGQGLSTQAGSPVRAGSVLILVARQAPDPDPYTVGALQILWQDGGTAWVLRDGRRWRGNWSLGPGGLPLVRGPGGAPLPVGRRGPYWYEVVPSAGAVTFS